MEFEHWAIIAILAFFLALFGVVGYVNHDDNATMQRMIQQGANPISARCAVKGISTENRTVCEASLH